MRHALTRWAFALATAAGCGLAPSQPIDRNGDGVCEGAYEEVLDEHVADASAPEPIVPTTQVSTAMPRPIAPANAARTPGSAWIASCFVPPREGVSSVTKTCLARIEAFDLDTGLPLFHADTRESGAVCFAVVPIGTRVEIRVDIDNPACAIAYWQAGFLESAGRPCACADTSAPSCSYVAEVDSYCGVVLSTVEL